MTAEYNCTRCDSPLVLQQRPYALRGMYLGRFDFLVCTVCKTVYHPEHTSLAIEEAAKAKGLWALGAEPAVVRLSLTHITTAEQRPLPDSLSVKVAETEAPSTPVDSGDEVSVDDAPVTYRKPVFFDRGSTDKDEILTTG